MQTLVVNSTSPLCSETGWARRLKSVVKDFRYSPYSQFEDFKMRAAGIILSLVPTAILRAVVDIRYGYSGASMLLIKGLPTDEVLPPTPCDGLPPEDRESFVSETVLLGFATLLGEPYAFRQERNGQVIHNICPVPNKGSALSSEGFAVSLDLHCDVAFSDFRPPFILMLGLRSGRGQDGKSIALDISDAYLAINAEYRAQLRKPDYSIRAPTSFGTGEEVDCPLITGPEDRPETRLNINTVKAHTRQAQAAMEELYACMRDIAEQNSVQLGAGDLFICNNLRVVHGRHSFEALFDGRDRWLQRVYVHPHLWHSESSPTYPQRVVE